MACTGLWRRAAVAALIGVGLNVWAAPAGLSETELMRRNLASGKVLDSVAGATFTLTDRSGAQRVRQTSALTKLQPNGDDNMRLVRFLAPADIKGTTTLLIEHAGADDDMWIYLPALKKVRRLAASNKKDSFVGTDFSYGDAIGHKVDDWTHRLLREEALDGVPCLVIESEPRSASVAADTGYSKRLTWVRSDNYVSPRVEIWDNEGKPLKRILASDIRQVGSNGRWQAMRTEAENLQTGHRTVIQLDGYKAEQNVAAENFTPGSLDRQ
jgi:hypothetical protein